MLDSITIENYKILKNIHLKLSHLTLVSGLNNMGKSSLIQVLLLLRQSMEQKVLTSKGLLLNGSYINVGNGKDAFSIDAEKELLLFFLNGKTERVLISISAMKKNQTCSP